MVPVAAYLSTKMGRKGSKLTEVATVAMRSTACILLVIVRRPGGGFSGLYGHLGRRIEPGLRRGVFEAGWSAVRHVSSERRFREGRVRDRGHVRDDKRRCLQRLHRLRGQQRD